MQFSQWYTLYTFLYRKKRAQLAVGKYMNEELEALEIFTQRLNDNSIPYMVSGSIAASYYAVPGMTRDIDIVIELREPDIDNFAALFEGDCYVDREMIKNEVRRQGAVRR